MPWVSFGALCFFIIGLCWYCGWRWHRRTVSPWQRLKWADGWSGWQDSKPRPLVPSPTPSPGDRGRSTATTTPPRSARRAGSVWDSGQSPSESHGARGRSSGGGFFGRTESHANLGAALRALRDCKEMWLERVSDGECYEIARALAPGQARNLQLLHISGSVGDTSGAGLADALADGGAPQLRELQLSRHALSDLCAEALARAVRYGQLQALEMLNLDHNDIGDVGATALAEAIRGAPRLEHLGLAANRIRDSGASRLADAIGVDGGAAALRRLDLYSNEIGDGGADALGAALDGRNRPRWGGGGAAEFLEVTLFGNPVSASMRARLRGIPGLDLGEKGVSPAGPVASPGYTPYGGGAAYGDDGTLPPDWGRRADGVYYSKVTGAISYTRPGPDPDEPVYAGGGAWEEWAADDGTPYFYNSATGETTWERPMGF